MTRSRIWGLRVGAIVLIVGVLALLAGFATLIVSSRDDARQQARERLVARGDLTAAFIATTVRDLEAREVQAVESRTVDGRLDPASFAAIVAELRLPAAVYLDAQGNLLDVWPLKPEILGTPIAQKYAHLAGAVAGRASVSNVVPSAARGAPVVGLATPIEGPRGRTVFSGGFDTTRTPITPYVRLALTQPGSQTYVVDENGSLVASSRGSADVGPLARQVPKLAAALATGTQGTFTGRNGTRSFTTEKVAGTPWRIVLSVPTAALYATAGGTIDTAWLVFAGFVAAAAGAAALFLVLRRRTRHLALANARLEAKQAEVGALLEFEQQFIARSSHELRNPLTSILGYLEDVVEGDEPLTVRQRTHLDVAYRNAQRLRVLVEDLLVLNETEGHELRLSLRPTTSATLLEPLTRDYEMQCQRAGLRFEADIPDDDPPMLIDRSRMEQVLTNLLANAVKFTPRGGSVGVRVRADEDSVRISVWDTGLGIAPDEIDEVFDRFFRSSSAEKRRVPGTGLGLPIARAMAVAQGAVLTATSRLGAGSVFTLTIPQVREPVAVAPAV